MKKKPFVSSRIITRRGVLSGMAASAFMRGQAHAQLPGMGQIFLPTPFGSGLFPNSFYGIIQNLGIGTGLVCAYDAGSIFSYPSTNSTQWIDEANGYNANLGSTFSNSAVFEGTPGALSTAERFLTSTDHAFVASTALMQTLQSWHKTDGKFSVLTIFNVGSLSAVSDLLFLGTIGATQGAGSPGMRLGVSNLGNLRLTLTSSVSFMSSSSTFPVGNDFFMGGALVDFSISSVKLVAGSSITSRSTNFTHSTIDAAGNSPGFIVPAIASPISCAALAAWNRQLSTAEYDTFYAAVKSLRFPALP